MKGEQTLQKMCGRTRLYLRRNSSTILTCIGAVGVVVTAVMSVRATPKAIKLLDEATKEKGEELTTLEVIKTAAPVYIPPVMIGASTLVCLFGANILSQKSQASLASAYALLENYHKEYRKTLIRLHGEEIDIEVRNEMARAHCGYHHIGLDVPDGKFIFYDEISGDSITCYEREIMDAEYHLNRNFTMRGYASYNEFRMFLGLSRVEYGEELGWTMSDGYSWIDFEHRLISQDDGGTEIYSIDMIFPPTSDYMREWE